jgi:uncharacterized membrane protein
MAYCIKCGGQLAEQAAFCPQCGAPQKPAAAAPAAPAASATGGLSENVAATLSYALGWLSGIIFLLVDKRPYVRFHAAQSLVVFGGLHVLRAAFGMYWGLGLFTGGWHMFGPGLLVFQLLSLLTFILWIVLMIKAHQGVRFKIPVVSEIADGLAGK